MKCVTKNSSAGISACREPTRRPRAAERDERKRQLGARVRVRDGAADRAAVPGHDVTDERQDSASSGQPMRTTPTLGAPGARARRFEADRSLGDLVEVRLKLRSTSTRGTHEPHVQRRARGSARRPGSSRRRRARRAAPPPRRPTLRRTYSNGAGFTTAAPRRRAGVSGSSTSSTPSASATAFAIAAGTLIVVPSPSPFAPSGVNGDGVSRCSDPQRRHVGAQSGRDSP